MSVINSNLDSAVLDPYKDKGIVYTIKNKDGKIFSYIIGTCHVSTKEMAHHPNLFKIIDKCSKLYIEAGGRQPFSTRFAASDLTEKRKKLKYAYSPDVAFAIRALAKTIPIFSLDLHIEHGVGVSQLGESSQKYIKENGFEAFEDAILNVSCSHFSSLSNDREFDEIHTQWASGNHAEINLDKNIIDRNKKWVDILRSELNKEAPSCIAVGDDHLMGDEGLVQLLRKEGFTVERDIYPSE